MQILQKQGSFRINNQKLPCFIPYSMIFSDTVLILIKDLNRLANDQTRPIGYTLLLFLRISDLPQNHLCSGSSQMILGMAHSGQAGNGVAGKLRVIETNQRNILRNTEAIFHQQAQTFHRHMVVITLDGRNLLLPHQLQHLK